jgi:hypothetical protein
MNYEHKDTTPSSTESQDFHLPEVRKYSAETDIDHSLVETLGSGVVHILIEQVPSSEATPVEVHHTGVSKIEVPTGWVDSTPVSEPGIPVEGASDRGKVVLDTHPNPKGVFGHPSNTTDQQIRNIAGR